MDKQRLDIMVDIETLGTKMDSTIFQISAKPFGLGHIPGEVDPSEFLPSYDINFTRVPCDISLMPINVDGSTIKWWLNTNPQLMVKLLSSGSGTEKDLLYSFRDWIIECRNLWGTNSVDVYLWGNDPMFDNTIIKNGLGRYGIEYPIDYNKNRDVRTTLELASMKLGISVDEFKKLYGVSSGEAHDAGNDVDFQISLIEKAYDVLLK